MFAQTIEWADGSEPCVANRSIFDSRFLTDFDPDDYLEDHAGVSENEIKKNEVLHLISQNMMIREAKQLCATCPVLDKCKSWALSEETDNQRIFGVVGGMSEEERLEERHPARAA